MARIRQSRPDYGLDFRLKFLYFFEVFALLSQAVRKRSSIDREDLMQHRIGPFSVIQLLAGSRHFPHVKRGVKFLRVKRGCGFRGWNGGVYCLLFIDLFVYLFGAGDHRVADARQRQLRH